MVDTYIFITDFPQVDSSHGGTQHEHGTNNKSHSSKSQEATDRSRGRCVLYLPKVQKKKQSKKWHTLINEQDKFLKISWSLLTNSHVMDVNYISKSKNILSLSYRSRAVFKTTRSMCGILDFFHRLPDDVLYNSSSNTVILLFGESGYPRGRLFHA